MTFQKNVLIVAIVILSIALGLIGAAMYYNKSDAKYPPVVADCPDYWVEHSGTGTGADTGSGICYNIKNLGKTECERTKDFSGPQWTGANGECNKYKWATACDLTWDGITNNSELCK